MVNKTTANIGIAAIGAGRRSFGCLHRCTSVRADEFQFGFLLLTSIFIFSIGRWFRAGRYKISTGSNICSLSLITLMQTTNPRNILTTLHLVRVGLASGLLSKEEVIDWADEIITRDKAPDIFFIDLALSNSKSLKDIHYYICDFLNFDDPAISGRPLLGLIYKKFRDKELTLEQTVRTLFNIKFEALFTEREEGCIYSIDDAYDCAKHGIYGTFEDVHKEVESFLSVYEDYALPNFEKWVEIDGITDQKMEEIYQQELDAPMINPRFRGPKVKKPWWNFW